MSKLQFQVKNLTLDQIRMMAAAPALLAACKRAAHCIARNKAPQFSPDELATLREIKHAITQAEGV